jgi:hypothetical protein
MLQAKGPSVHASGQGAFSAGFTMIHEAGEKNGWPKGTTVVRAPRREDSQSNLV